MLSREQAITQLNAYGVPLSEEQWQSETVREDGEFGVFAVIIRVIAGLFILGMVSISIAGFIVLIGQEANWQTVTGIIGVLATGFAGWKFRYSYKALEKQYSFKGLLYLSLLLVGKACLLAALFGMFEYWTDRLNGIWTIALIFSAITLGSCFYYRMYLEAFLAVLVSLFLLDWALVFQFFVVARPVAITILIVSLVGLIWWQKQRNMSSVFLYATVLFLGYKLLPDWINVARMFATGELPDPNINIGLSIVAFTASLALYTFLVGGWQKLKSVQHLIVIIGIAILAFVGVHGVMLSVALMALGHVRHDKVLWVIGLIFLPLYLFAFYYTLDATLLTKSYMLIGSGIAILLVRYMLSHFVVPTSGEADHA